MKKLLVVAFFIACAACPRLIADTTYTYTGNSTGSHTAGQGGAVWGDYSSPYTANDSITMSFTVSSALPANLPFSFGNVYPTVSWSWSDGIETITSADSQAATGISIGTDGNGNIVDWFNWLYWFNTPGDFDTNGSMESVNVSALFGAWDGAGGNLPNNDGGKLYVVEPGTWKESTLASPAPEPSSFLLLVTGAIFLGSLIQRKVVA